MKTASSATSKRPRTLAGNAPASSDGARANAVAQYESALRLMQEGKFEKAHTAFNQMPVSYTHLPPAPVNATVTNPCSRAARSAAITFSLLPEVEIATSTSPRTPSASTCRAKTAPNP